MPLLEEPVRYAKLLTTLKAKSEDVTYERKLSPYECSSYIEELISDFGDADKALEALPIKKDMFDHFRRLQKISNKYKRSIVWQKTTDIGVVFSAAANIAKLDDVQEQEYLFQATLDYKLSKEETDHIVRLRNANPGKSIEDCVVEIKNFRPDVIPVYYVVLNLNNEIIVKLNQLEKLENKKGAEILKEIFESKLEQKIKAVTIKKNNLALVLDKNAYEKFEKIRNEKKIDDYELVPFFLRGEKFDF